MGSTTQIIETANTPLNTTVPILTDNAAANNNQGFAVGGSSATSGNTFFNPFSTGGAAYWQPSTAGNEFITVTFPYQVINRGFLYQCRGATNTNYYSGCSIQASNDNATWRTLCTIPDNLMQNQNVNTVQFPNIYTFKYYRFFITSTVGTTTNLGIFNMQYAGYVLF